MLKFGVMRANNMAKIGLYAGSFDPVTNGHLDIIKRANQLFDKMYIALMTNTSKSYTFDFTEKSELLNAALKPLNLNNVEVVTAKGQLLAQVADKLGADYLIRGLRTESDFNYEAAMGRINKHQNKNLDTVYMISSPQYMDVSSSMIKEVAHYGGNISGFVPKNVELALKDKLGVN